MRLQEMIHRFELQNKINPVPECDKEAAIAYFIKHGYNISDSYHSNPEETYRPLLSPALAEIMFSPTNHTGKSVPFTCDITQWLRYYTYMCQEHTIPVYNLPLPVSEFLLLCGVARWEIPSYISQFTNPTFVFKEEDERYAVHLVSELRRCQGNFGMSDNVREVASDSMRFRHLIANLNLYRVLCSEVEDFTYQYWRLDQSLMDNVAACGYTGRSLTKFLLKEVVHHQWASIDTRPTGEELEEVFQWKKVANFINPEGVEPFITSILYQWFKEVNKLSLAAYHLLPSGHPIWNLFQWLSRNELGRATHYPGFKTLPKNPLTYLWLMEHPTWLESHTMNKEEGILIHHHQVCDMIFEKFTILDFSKHPSYYAAQVMEEIYVEKRRERESATRYHQYEFLQYLDPEEFTYISDSYQLTTEGNIMRHCVGGYNQSILNGQSIILHWNDKDSRGATIEISPIGPMDYELDDVMHFKMNNIHGEIQNFVVMQIRGSHNADLPTDTQINIVEAIKTAAQKSLEGITHV